MVSLLCLFQQISTYFTDKLLGIVRDTILHMKSTSASENDHQIGSKCLKGDAALEFIKHICAVLVLDQSVQHDVLVFFFLSFNRVWKTLLLSCCSECSA